MPIYDFLCPCCERKQEDVFLHRHDTEVKCKQCGAKMKRLFSSVKYVAAKVFPADGVFLEHVEADGKRFFSKKEMRDYEKKTGTVIGMLH